MMARIIFTDTQIQTRVRELARQISDDFRGTEIVLVGLLRGAFRFHADLAGEIERIRLTAEGVSACYIDFMSVSSYGDGQQSTGRVHVQLDVQSLEGRHVVVVDDVAETMHTTHFVVTHLLAKRPASVRMCVLIAKPDRHQRHDVTLDYVGFSQVGLPFLKGYGMDNKGAERGLPYIASCD